MGEGIIPGPDDLKAAQEQLAESVKSGPSFDMGSIDVKVVKNHNDLKDDPNKSGTF